MACYRLVFASLLPPFVAEISRKVPESNLDSLVRCQAPEQVRDSEKSCMLWQTCRETALFSQYDMAWIPYGTVNTNRGGSISN